VDSEGSSETESEEGFTDSELEYRLEDFNKLIDTAHQLFDGKYSIETITTMPYKVLVRAMDREQKILEATAEAKANKKMNKAMETLGM
jgi:hypothetical protein